MELSLDSALLILNKWVSESTVIGLVTHVLNLEVKVHAQISHVDNETVVVSWMGHYENHIVIHLADCVFDYTDEREYSEIPIPPEGRTFISVLTIQYPPKEIVCIFETDQKHI
jgi:hypothetical protein